MTARKISIIFSSIFSCLAAVGAAYAESGSIAAPPLARGVAHTCLKQPSLTECVIAAPRPVMPATRTAAGRKALANSSWQTVPLPSSLNPGSIFLLHDGSVMVQDMGKQGMGSGRWWKLSPDLDGSYATGTWIHVATLPAGYAPNYFSSAVLNDGKLLVVGGEYNNGVLADSTRGALYDPLANRWTNVASPKGPQWTEIGDAPAVVLASGQFMMNAITGPTPYAGVLFNEASLTWTPTGTGKADSSDEEGLALLPDDTVLTVDHMPSGPGNNAEIYSPQTGAWTGSGSTKTMVFSQTGCEVGPETLRPDGTVFVAGATGHTAIYDSNRHAWSAGPDFPRIANRQYTTADAPAAVLPSGKILIMASPDYDPPSHFFVFDGTSLSQVTDPVYPQPIPAYQGRMLVLPTGQVLFTDSFGDMEIYTDRGTANAAWAPQITDAPRVVARGKVYALTGKQLNGVTQGSTYGDDFQNATNYPLVQIVNIATGHVFYAPTSGSSTTSIAPGLVSSTNFQIPAGIEGGPAELMVVANGIASAPIMVTVTQ